jgi:hypothetical protein
MNDIQEINSRRVSGTWLNCALDFRANAPAGAPQCTTHFMDAHVVDVAKHLLSSLDNLPTGTWLDVQAYCAPEIGRLARAIQELDEFVSKVDCVSGQLAA